MSTLVSPVHMSSKEELYARLEEILEVQKRDSIVCIRGLKLTEGEQLQLVKDLGDLVGWYPNNSGDFSHKYVENHASNEKVSNSTGDEIILKWHMEHIDYDQYVPIVAGVWNMRKFNCDKENGKTYFIDSRKLYQKLFSEEEKVFLRNAVASHEDHTLNKEEIITIYVNLVQNHWLTGEEQLRIELHHQSDSFELHKIDGKTVSKEELQRFRDLIKRFREEVYENEELRIIHKWEEGDILIPDLFSLAHAVTGGFDPEDREFTGYWCYADSPEKFTQETTHPDWKIKIDR
jgi:alpha-ketoglutarate-dependent taurine dioxygenase